MTFFDFDEGATCGIGGCTGTLVTHHRHDGGCSCHTGCAPCSYCTDTYLSCNKCGIDSDLVDGVMDYLEAHQKRQQANADESRTRQEAEDQGRQAAVERTRSAEPLYRAMQRQNGVPGMRPWECDWIPRGERS